MQKIVAEDRKQRVLIAGIQQSDNQFVRAVESYGMTPIHFGPNNGNGKTFPIDADAVICVTSFTSHKYFWEVKDAYKAMGKRVFLASQGFSEIKKEFESYFISDLKKNMDSLKWNSRFYYMLGHFMRDPGVKFKLCEFEFKIKRFYPDLPPMGTFIQNATEDGTLERKERAKYVFKGLSKKRVALFKSKYSLDVPSGWQRIEPEVVIPPPEPAKAVTQEVITQEASLLVPEAKKTANEDVALLLAVVSDLDQKVERMNGYFEKLLKFFNPELQR